MCSFHPEHFLSSHSLPHESHLTEKNNVAFEVYDVLDWYFNFIRVLSHALSSPPILSCAAKYELFSKSRALAEAGLSLLQALVFGSTSPDRCQISICIIICSVLKGNLAPKFYGSANCNNQCFIVSWKRKKRKNSNNSFFFFNSFSNSQSVTNSK